MTSMLSSSSTTPDSAADRCLSVRFEDSCVLIPPAGPAKSTLRPRIITKSYSLPLWKTSSSKKNITFQSLVSEVNEAADAEAERKAFSLTVSVPSLTTRSRRRRSSIPPPSPCLSKRNLSLPRSSDSNTPPSSPASSPASSTPLSPSPSLHRAPSFPRIQPATLKQAETIPLRPCCEACHSCVDAALAEGESWSTQWSRGAVRRYSEGEHVHLHVLHPSECGGTRGWNPKGACDDAGGDMPLEDSLTIDEVDVKRRFGDYSHATLNNHHVPPPATEDADSDDENVFQESTATTPLVPLDHSAIFQEEDEDMLFPLPSPRRTPNHSPNLTPTGSQVSLATLPSGNHTNIGISGSQTNLSAPAVSSPLASQEIESPDPVAQSPPPARLLPPVSITPAESAPDPSPPGSLSLFPVQRRQRSSSPETRRAPVRRSSFSTASESFLRGSAVVLKGVATGMKAGAGGVGAMR